MIKKITALFFIVFIAISSYAQKNSGIISGVVIDQEGELSLPGATLTFNNGQRYTISNSDGSYEFLDVPVGIYQVAVHYLGFQTQTLEAEVFSGKNTKLNFILSTESSNLNAVVIKGSGLRGQAKALNQQRNNQNISNIISSDQVGRFPDANIGDALKRVPGITVQNDQGEARDIIIRGLAPELNSVTLNGDRIPSAEGDNRNVQMDLIPSDMISTIEVNKTLTSDMDADAIGGSVNLITRASPNGKRFSTTLAGGYSPIREKGNYTAGLVYANRFLDNTLGAVISGSYNNNNFGSDNIEAEWKEGKNGQTYVSQKDVRRYDVQRIRQSVAVALDYEVNQYNKLYTNAMYTNRMDRENRYKLQYRKMNPIYDSQDNITSFTGDILRENKGGIDNNRNKNKRLEEQRVQNYSIGGEHLISSKLDLEWQANYASASEEKPNERYISFQSKNLAMQQDLSDRKFPYVQAVDEDLDRFELQKLTEGHQHTKEEEIGAKINLRMPLTILKNQKGRLRTGLRLRRKDKQRNNLQYEYTPIEDFGSLKDVPTNFYGNTNWQAGPHEVPGHFVDKSFLGNLDLTDKTKFKEELNPSKYLSKNYRAKEQITAGYVRWDQDITNRLSLITGFRIEHTNMDYTGNYVMAEEELLGEVRNTNSYTDLLPSFAIKYNLQDNSIVRFAITSALARPNYYSLAPYVNADIEDQEIFAGNPDLETTKATNVDLMFEKYLTSVGIISAGAFYKKMNDFIYDAIDNNYTKEKFDSDFPDQFNPIEPGENWSFVQSKNGDNVDVYGFEIALQRQLDFISSDFFKAMGIYMNYTYTKSKTKGITNKSGEIRKDMPLPGTAPHLLNGSLSWENKKLSIRVSANYASDYLDEIGGDSFEDRFYDSQFFLDVNASYKLTNTLRIFAEANNLTNQPLRYYQGNSKQTMQVEYYQPTFNLGLKLDL